MELSFFDSYEPPQDRPGRYTDGTSWADKLHKAVRRKWRTPEEKEWWYKKYRAALRNKTAYRFREQGGLCFFCRNQCFLGEGDRNGLGKKRVATADHVIPQSQGGTDHLSNLVMACAACNQHRGDMKFGKFKRLRLDPVKWNQYVKEMMARTQVRRAKVKAKRAHKGPELAWKIGLLLYLKPEWRPVVDSIHAEFVRRRKVLEDRLAARRENIMIDKDDILVDS